jgi:hypothetical protein
MIPENASPSTLRLQALDAADLTLLSAHVQDATLRVGDMAYLRAERRFALLAARFDWESQPEGQHQRCATGLHFEAVRAVRSQGVARERPDDMLALLAVVFEPDGEGPEGRVRLVFAGGATILLEVDCIEAQLADLGPRWEVSSCPAHKLDEGAGAGP